MVRLQGYATLTLELCCSYTELIRQFLYRQTTENSRVIHDKGPISAEFCAAPKGLRHWLENP